MEFVDFLVVGCACGGGEDGDDGDDDEVFLLESSASPVSLASVPFPPSSSSPWIDSAGVGLLIGFFRLSTANFKCNLNASFCSTNCRILLSPTNLSSSINLCILSTFSWYSSNFSSLLLQSRVSVCMACLRDVVALSAAAWFARETWTCSSRMVFCMLRI